MIPIYVISRCAEERMHLPRLFKQRGIQFMLVVDTLEQAQHARSLGFKKVLVSGAHDIVECRNFINQYTTGWYLGFDDNIRGFTQLNPKFWKHDSLDVTSKELGINWREQFRHECTPEQFIEGMQHLVEVCKLRKAAYGGVATCENPYFRARKYSFYRFVKTKAFVMNADAELHFKHTMCHDSYTSALAVAKQGCVVVLNYLFYTANWYESGGLGKREERDAKGLTKQLIECVDEFPGLVSLASGKNSALRFRLTNERSVTAWRRQHGWLGKNLV